MHGHIMKEMTFPVELMKKFTLDVQLHDIQIEMAWLAQLTN